MRAVMDRNWESMDDARTLARADEIRKDKARLARAVNAAKEMARDKENELVAMRKIANFNTSNSGKTSNVELFRESIDNIMRR